MNIAPSLSYGYGEINDDIRLIQQRLKTLGYFNDDPTGFFGMYTVETLQAFETANTITVDGYADHSDLVLLFSADAKRALR